MSFLKKLFGMQDEDRSVELDLAAMSAMVVEVLEEWSERIEIEKALIASSGRGEWTARGGRDNNNPAILIRFARSNDHARFYIDVMPGIPFRTMRTQTSRGLCWEKTRGGEAECKATREDLQRTLHKLCRRADELGCV